jgi:hypothetical protein
VKIEENGILLQQQHHGFSLKAEGSASFLNGVKNCTKIVNKE